MKRYIIFFAAILVCLPLTLTAQKSGSGSKKKVTISGLITGSDNKPVSGARIYIDSLFTGSVSDDFGKYKVKVSPDAKKIIASSPDHGYCQADINNLTTLDLMLNGEVKSMGVFLAKNTRQGPAQKTPKVKKINTYTDIYQMIRQEVSGVLVSGRSIVVQQQNSFYGSSSPLFVVNGVRVNSIDNINPAEVKSIQLLKGSYANIYGNDGANGVISITLISGK